MKSAVGHFLFLLISFFSIEGRAGFEELVFPGATISVNDLISKGFINHNSGPRTVPGNQGETSSPGKVSQASGGVQESEDGGDPPAEENNGSGGMGAGGGGKKPPDDSDRNSKYMGGLYPERERLLELWQEIVKALESMGQSVVYLVDIDNTARYSASNLRKFQTFFNVSDSLVAGQQQTMAGLQSLFREHRKEPSRRLLVYATARKVTTEKDTGQGYINLEGGWPSAALNGLPEPDILIHSNGQGVQGVGSAFNWENGVLAQALVHLQGVLDGMNEHDCWEFDVRPQVRSVVRRYEETTARIATSEKSIRLTYTSDSLEQIQSLVCQRSELLLIPAPPAGILNHAYIFDPAVNKLTTAMALIHRLIRIGFFSVIPLVFPSGDDMDDLPILFPRFFRQRFPNASLFNMLGVSSADEEALLSNWQEGVQPIGMAPGIDDSIQMIQSEMPGSVIHSAEYLELSSVILHSLKVLREMQKGEVSEEEQ